MNVSIGYIRRLFIFCCSILQPMGLSAANNRLTEVILLLSCYPMSVSVGWHPAMECCCWLHDFYWAMPGTNICFPSSLLIASFSCVTPVLCALSANRSRDAKDIPSAPLPSAPLKLLRQCLDPGRSRQAGCRRWQQQCR